MIHLKKEDKKQCWYIVCILDYIYIIDLFNVYYMDAHDKNYAFALSAVWKIIT